VESYRVSVITGNVRGAGTRSGVKVQLIGSEGSSDLIEVGNSMEDGLRRNSTTTFDVLVPRELGTLRRVYVERDKASSTDTGDGWYLDQVNVVGPQNDVHIFPCNSWFGHSDCGDYAGGWSMNSTQQGLHGDSCRAVAGSRGGQRAMWQAWPQWGVM
jgi:hypothetical protein